MFTSFFYQLKTAGIPVSPTAFLTLQRALDRGLVRTLDDFYTCARSILVKSERYFDLYDQVFAHYFQGAPLPETDGMIIDEMAQAMLEEWLRDPKPLSHALGLDPDALSKWSPDELLAYFKDRLKEQKGRHEGGNKWIGTGGTSPVGHSGIHPGGMRVQGVSRNRSAVKVAAERRYRDYSGRGPLTRAMMGEALKRLRNMVPTGPKDRLNVDETVRLTMKNGGEIELVFDRSLKDRLKVILAIDNGGWSMDPYIPMVQALFDYARAQFKTVTTCFFHNTIYDCLWKDPARYRLPMGIDGFAGMDPDTRFIAVGDASMAPYELMAQDGSIHIHERSGKPSIERLRFIREVFSRAVWLNPVPREMWGYTPTIRTIGSIIPMFELSLDGLERAVAHMMAT